MIPGYCWLRWPWKRSTFVTFFTLDWIQADSCEKTRTSIAAWSCPWNNPWKTWLLQSLEWLIWLFGYRLRDMTDITMQYTEYTSQILNKLKTISDLPRTSQNLAPWRFSASHLKEFTGGSPLSLSVLLGISSAVVDNVPLVQDWLGGKLCETDAAWSTPKKIQWSSDQITYKQLPDGLRASKQRSSFANSMNSRPPLRCSTSQWTPRCGSWSLCLLGQAGTGHRRLGRRGHGWRDDTKRLALRCMVHTHIYTYVYIYIYTYNIIRGSLVV